MEVPIPIPPIAIPNEIISKILSHLGKNDLLKCRLVSQSWNGLSLKILRNPKYGHEHELTQDNIQKFIEFSKERQEEWVLPFHLNLTRRKYKRTVDYHQNPNNIQQLQTIFGEKCVVGLTLSHDSGSSLKCVQEIMSILTLIAPSLTHLDLSDFHVEYDEEEEKLKMKEMLGKTQLNFTNLSKLMSCPAPTFWGDVLDNSIHSFLIQNSPNLKELQVISPRDLISLGEVSESLRKLRIVEGMEDLVTILEPIVHILPSRVLKELSFTYSNRLSQREHGLLYDFLLSFSNALQSLTVIFEAIPQNPFPRLSQLKFLRISVPPNICRVYVDSEKLNWTSEAFPVLESMDIPTNVYFESAEANSQDDWTLRTVKTLSIRVLGTSHASWLMDEVDDEHDDEDVEIIYRASAMEYVDHLHELFPNVTSLTLVNGSDGHEEYLNQLLIEFVQSDGAPKIQELEIQNCEKNYLGHILNGLDLDRQPRVIIENMSLDEELLKAIKKAFQLFSGRSFLSVDKQMEFRDGEESRVMTCKVPIPMHFKMTGLERIHLSFSEQLNHKSGQSTSEQKSKQKDLFLMSLPKHLPLLRQIDISHPMFGQNKDFCKEQIVNVQDEFPDLVINATY